MEIDSKPAPYTGEKAGLVGIIPIHGIESSFDLPWQDIFMPLNKGLTAVERAVYECAFAGCTSIWIVCNDDIAPVLKHRVGECVGDPVWQYRAFELNPDHKARQIPIYYVPLNPKDLKRRDSLSWSIIYGALTYNKFSYQISKWLVPEKFYVTFPWGIYDPRFIREHRQLIRSCDRFLLSHDDETVKENKFLAFTFTPDDVQPMKRYIYHECTGQNREKLHDMQSILRDSLVSKRSSTRAAGITRGYKRGTMVLFYGYLGGIQSVHGSQNIHSTYIALPQRWSTYQNFKTYFTRR